MSESNNEIRIADLEAQVSTLSRMVNDLELRLDVLTGQVELKVDKRYVDNIERLENRISALEGETTALTMQVSSKADTEQIIKTINQGLRSQGLRLR